MPAIAEVLALPPPSADGLGTLPPAQLPAARDDAPEDGGKENGEAPAAAPTRVATQTRSIGMIHPPPDIRSIVDKTAQFVARNGPEFEKRILANEKNNVKFNFLNPTDPYHAYYQHRVSEVRAQGQVPAQPPAVVAKPAEPGGAAKPAEQTGASAAVTVGAPKIFPDFLRPTIKAPEQPEPEQYTVRLPEGLTGLDLDIIKLTAQFVARNGKSFLTGLTSREHMNPQFHFLKPTHSMFTFFTALADAYSKVLMPAKGLVEKLKANTSSKTVVLERCLSRLEWERSQERARQKAEDEIEQERMQMALIDWHDFVVVETIEFDEDEDELPKPMTLDEVVRRSKALAMEEAEEEVTEAGKEVEMEMDEEEVQLVEDSLRAATLKDSIRDNGVIQIDEDPDHPMRIVKNWKRPEERLAAEKDLTKYVVSPITGELVSINEMAEHMRISLIDPKYKEQKERMLAKLRETTLATDDEISRNIVGLARTRPDIFGTTEEEVSNAVKAEIEKKKEEPKQVIWDGHTGSISRTANQAMAQNMSTDEQMDAAQKERLIADGRQLPGPIPPPVPKLAPTPARPLPPPPGLALNIPRPAQTSQQVPVGPPGPPPPPGSISMIRSPILPTPPAIRPSAPPTMPPVLPRPNPPPPQSLPPPMAAPPRLPQYAPLPPLARPFAPLPPQPLSIPPPPPPAAPVLSIPPPPLPEEDPPPPPDEPEPKRQKTDECVPEDQWLAQHPGAVRIVVSVPTVEGDGNLKGQYLDLTIQSLAETVGSLKEKIATDISLPANKQKLTFLANVLKDSASLAFYNVGPGETVSLGLKERGGRKR